MIWKGCSAVNRMVIELNGREYPVELIRARQKTISMRVKEGVLVVRAPKYLNAQAVFDLVMEKQALLSNKVRQAEEWERAHPKREFKDQERYPYLGEDLILTVIRTDGNTSRVKKDGNRLLFMTPHTEPEQIEQLLGHWYKKAARQFLSERVEHFKPILGEWAAVNRIAVKEQKSCWGSCSAKHNLNFNWHLMEFPPEVVDYVVVHELCHLRHMDHSPAFWAEVERILPDYRERRAVLKAAKR